MNLVTIYTNWKIVPVECPMPEVTAANETVSLPPMAERL